MVAFQIRDVADEIRNALVAEAKTRGQSLQSYLLELVETQGRRLRNTAIPGRFAGRSDGAFSLPGQSAAEAELLNCPLVTGDARLAKASGIRCEITLIS